MRDLLTKVDPTFMSQFSVVVFSLSFVALIIWVFLPSRKKQYEANSKIPLEN